MVLALFLGGGATGRSWRAPCTATRSWSAATAGRSALLAAWAVPDLEAAREGSYYEGDLLGAGALAAVLLAMPFAVAEASWLAGVTGALLGLVLGFGRCRLGPREL